jgi:hypothetical protein
MNSVHFRSSMLALVGTFLITTAAVAQFGGSSNPRQNPQNTYIGDSTQQPQPLIQQPSWTNPGQQPGSVSVGSGGAAPSVNYPKKNIYSPYYRPDATTNQTQSPNTQTITRPQTTIIPPVVISPYQPYFGGTQQWGGNNSHVPTNDMPDRPSGYELPPNSPPNPVPDAIGDATPFGGATFGPETFGGTTPGGQSAAPAPQNTVKYFGGKRPKDKRPPIKTETASPPAPVQSNDFAPIQTVGGFGLHDFGPAVSNPSTTQLLPKPMSQNVLSSADKYLLKQIKEASGQVGALIDQAKMLLPNDQVVEELIQAHNDINKSLETGDVPDEIVVAKFENAATEVSKKLAESNDKETFDSPEKSADGTGQSKKTPTDSTSTGPKDSSGSSDAGKNPAAGGAGGGANPNTGGAGGGKGNGKSGTGSGGAAAGPGSASGSGSPAGSGGGSGAGGGTSGGGGSGSGAGGSGGSGAGGAGGGPVNSNSPTNKLNPNNSTVKSQYAKEATAKYPKAKGQPTTGGTESTLSDLPQLAAKLSGMINAYGLVKDALAFQGPAITVPVGVTPVIVMPLLPLGKMFILPTGVLMVGTGQVGFIHVVSLNASAILGIPIASMAPVPDSEEEKAGPISRGVLVRNPTTNNEPVDYVIASQWQFVLELGQVQYLPEKAHWQIAFSRGDGFQTARYKLAEGTYAFGDSENGRELYRESFRVTIDNSGNKQDFHCVVDNTPLSVAAGYAETAESRYPIVVRFNRGQAGADAAKRIMEADAVLAVAVNPKDGLWDLFPADTPPDASTIASSDAPLSNSAAASPKPKPEVQLLQLLESAGK